VTDQTAALRTVRHQHGQLGPHDHTAADYAAHQQPIDDEQIIAEERGPIARTVAEQVGDDQTAYTGPMVPFDHAPGDTSDGFHTFDELYEHRRALTSVLATIGSLNGDAWRSKAHHPDDGPMFDDHFIVGIELPEGAITYHYALEHWDRFAAVPELEHAPKWDGADAADTILRLDAFTRHLKTAIDEGREVQQQARQAADAVVEAAEQPVGATDPDAFDPDRIVGSDGVIPEVRK